MPINGVALSSVAIGSVLIWSGIKGWNLTQTFGEVITGKVPSGTEVYPLTSASDGTSGSSSSGSATGIAADATAHIGHAYSYGGAPGKDGKSPWDCSSMVNWIVGHDAGKAIPGYGPGKYDGSVHGPPTGSWGIWPGLQHISASQLQANDIIVWAGHMGIAVSNTEMVSALNGTLGTLRTKIAGYGNGPLLCYGRLK